MPAPREVLSGRLRLQAQGCAELGSPFYAALLESAAADLEAGGAVWDLLAGYETESEATRAAVIVVSVMPEERDKVRALDVGADDYMVKPFGTEELVARIRAVLRRQADVTAGEPVIRAGGLEIDIGRRTVTVEGRPVRLTPTEYELLRYLALHAGKPVTHTTLLRQVWGDYAVGDKYNTRYVVAQIRKKLGDNPANPRYIVNEPGVGYRLEG